MNANAHTIRTTLLEPAMDARAHSIGIARVLRALTEPLQLLAASATPAQKPVLLTVLGAVREIHAHNEKAGDLHRELCGTADRMATDARAAETGRDPAAALGVQAIARRLRGPLDVLGNPRGRSARDVTEAMWAVKQVARDVPRDRLLSVAVRHELGVRKFTTLTALLTAPTEAAA
ncbi:MAG TPA: hypothetical protein VN213_02735 [Solirubrobacteraceae bacterium]|nr:hypothetical protein [Solirubrobacteraceae bacterium]